MNGFSLLETSVRDKNCRVFNDNPSLTQRVRIQSTLRSHPGGLRNAVGSRRSLIQTPRCSRKHHHSRQRLSLTTVSAFEEMARTIGREWCKSPGETEKVLSPAIDLTSNSETGARKEFFLLEEIIISECWVLKEPEKSFRKSGTDMQRIAPSSHVGSVSNRSEWIMR